MSRNVALVQIFSLCILGPIAVIVTSNITMLLLQIIILIVLAVGGFLFVLHLDHSLRARTGLSGSEGS